LIQQFKERKNEAEQSPTMKKYYNQQ